MYLRDLPFPWSLLRFSSLKRWSAPALRNPAGSLGAGEKQEAWKPSHHCRESAHRPLPPGWMGVGVGVPWLPGRWQTSHTNPSVSSAQAPVHRLPPPLFRCSRFPSAGAWQVGRIKNKSSGKKGSLATWSGGPWVRVAPCTSRASDVAQDHRLPCPLWGSAEVQVAV